MEDRSTPDLAAAAQLAKKIAAMLLLGTQLTACASWLPLDLKGQIGAYTGQVAVAKAESQKPSQPTTSTDEAAQ